MLYSKEDFKLAEDYVAAAIGMDKLFRESTAENDKEGAFKSEGLLPIQLTDVTGLQFNNWEEAIAKLETLERAYELLPNSNRRFYMLQQIHSTKSIAQWQNGHTFSFPEKVKQFLKVNAEPIPQAEINQDLKALEGLLVKQGIKKDTLAQSVAYWESLFVVDNVKEIGDHYLLESKKELVNLGFREVEDVPAEVEMVDNVPYNAYCDYLSRKIYINSDLQYTSFHLKHLAVHEAFPGHMTHMTIREKLMREGTIPLDAGLVFTNTASSSIFEGIAENGLRFLKWDQSIDDQIFLILQGLRSKIALNAAYYYHVENMDKDKIIQYFMQFGFGNENWASSRYRFISHFFRGPFIYSYWRGQEAVSKKMDQLELSEHKKFYRFILENMQSADSVQDYA